MMDIQQQMPVDILLKYILDMMRKTIILLLSKSLNGKSKKPIVILAEQGGATLLLSYMMEMKSKCL